MVTVAPVGFFSTCTDGGVSCVGRVGTPVGVSAGPLVGAVPGVVGPGVHGTFGGLAGLGRGNVGLQVAVLGPFAMVYVTELCTLPPETSAMAVIWDGPFGSWVVSSGNVQPMAA